MNGEREAWYVDSLDALGGRAFASFRKPRHLREKIEAGGIASALSFAIMPPEFSPEPVSEVTALGASRGAFQEGLRDADLVEIRFTRLEEVVEFVRRAYTSGGGGTGGGGGGLDFGGEPPANPRLPRGARESPGERSTESNFGRQEALLALMADVRSFSEAVKSNPREPGSTGFSWSNARSPSAASDSETLQFTGQDLLQRLIEEAPGTLKPHRNFSWRTAIHALGAVLAEFGILDQIFTRVLRQPTRDGPHRLSTYFRDLLDVRYSQLRNYRAFQFSARMDAFDRLYAIPISGIEVIDWKGGGKPTLGHLLSRFLASPHIVLKPADPLSRYRVLGYCLFAAASLTVPTVGAGPISIRRHGVDAAYLGTLTAAASTWLATNLPRIALTTKLEEKIERSATLDYQSTTSL